MKYTSEVSQIQTSNSVLPEHDVLLPASEVEVALETQYINYTT
jgi:hypothetical protein